jgi:hypothetical protein
MVPARKPPTAAEKKNPLLSDAAQSVLAMGYLPRIVKVAVDKVLQSKGKAYMLVLYKRPLIAVIYIKLQ